MGGMGGIGVSVVSIVWVIWVVWKVSGSLCYRWYSSLSIAPYYNCGTQVAVVTRYRISNYFHTTISFNSGSKVAVVTRYQLPNYFHITTYPLTPLHKSSPPPSAVPFLLSCKPSIGVTEVTQSQNSNYIHLTCHVYCCKRFSSGLIIICVLSQNLSDFLRLIVAAFVASSTNFS